MLLFGQQELYLGEDGEGGSAEERIRTLLGDADRGLARRWSRAKGADCPIKLAVVAKALLTLGLAG